MDADLASAQALIEPGKPLSVFYLDSEVNGLDSESRRSFVTTLLAAASRKRQLLTTDPVLSRLRAVRENRMIDIPFTHLVPTVGSANVVLGLARQFRDMRQELSPTL